MTGAAPARFYLSGRLLCASSDEAEIVACHLPEHIRLSRAEPGCLSFEVTQEGDPLVWRVDECFTDRAAFELHQTRTRASDWGRATSAIARVYESWEAQAEDPGAEISG